jgi:hypothetical protein
MSNKPVDPRLLNTIGAANPSVLRASGVANPEEAARVAALGTEEANRQQDLQARQEGERAELSAIIAEAIRTDGFNPELGKDPSELSLAELREVHKQLEAFWDEVVDQTERVVDDQLEKGPDPADPWYRPISDKQRRQQIESRLEPMDFDSLVFRKHVDQVVPINDNLNITLRTVRQRHAEWLEAWAADQDRPDAQNRFMLAQLAVSLVAINDTSVLPDLSKEKDRDRFEQGLERKLDALGEYPSVLTEDMVVQYVWFVGRVRKLLGGSLSRRLGN